MKTDIDGRQKLEMDFWRNSKHQSPGANSIYNIVNKVTDGSVFLDYLNKYKNMVVTDGRILELGSGQGWASCLYKRLFPNTHITATDLSEFAIASLPIWERLFEVKIDNSYACKSYEIEEENSSLDQIFCFASAHHFMAHRRTLHEIERVLKPGGKAIYFHEPATPRYLYSLALWKVQRNKPQLPEDVLISSELRALAYNEHLKFKIDYYPSLKKREPFEMVYFSILRRIPFLQPLLPCSANFFFIKQEAD